MDDELVKYRVVMKNQFRLIIRKYTRTRLISLLQKYIKKAIWLNGMAGRGWLDDFLHPHALCMKTVWKVTL